jgi:hypothetical protein
MTRNRKSSQNPPTETPTSVVDTSTVVADAPVVEAAEAPGSFAEQVGQKKWAATPDPFGIASDTVAGVRLFESKQDRQMAIKFGDGGPEDKPSQAVIDELKNAGYRWNPQHRVWTHSVRPDTAMSTRIEAEQLYQGLCQMIRQEKGIESGQEVPF